MFSVGLKQSEIRIYSKIILKREEVDIILIMAEQIRQQYDVLVKGGKKVCARGGICLN